MTTNDFDAKIDSYIESVWEEMVAEIGALVSIPSTEDLPNATPEAPFGPEPLRALEAGLALADRLGFTTKNVDGYIGYADLEGESDTQLGMIGHLDVVPAGTGWCQDPFTMTRKEGYLMGRGVADNKGPSVVALYVMKYFKEAGEKLPYTIRMLMGSNEETGMADVKYYRENYADPAFIFTPDAEFPVCNGEKGLYRGILTSKPLGEDSIICDFTGGNAFNAVPSIASLLVRAQASELATADKITIEQEGDCARLTAEGIGGHAAMPEGTINAIGLLVDYVLANNLCTDDERPFFELQQKLLSTNDGSGVDLDCADEYFDPLTLVGGMVYVKDGSISQTIDVRFPTVITYEEITAKLAELGQGVGATYEQVMGEKPFLMKPDSPMILALLNSFNEITGMDMKSFTIGGGTYARQFSSGASFGPHMPWLKDQEPEWVGNVHSFDEAVSEDMLKQAMKIYIKTFDALMKLDF